MYHLKRYWIWITALITCVVVLSYFAINNKISTEIFIGGGITILTLFISIINHYQDSDRFFKELFTEFNLRYDKMNSFLNQVKDEDKFDEVGKQKIIDYLNLCAEEYMWVKRGRLPSHIWNSWRNGIHYHLKKQPIKQVFEEEKSLWRSSYYGFFEAIEKV